MYFIQHSATSHPSLTASTRTLNLNTAAFFHELCFLFRGTVRNGNPRVCFYFSSTERNSELFFSSAEGFGREFREFASVFDPRNGIPSCFLFRGRVRNGIPKISVRRNSRNSVRNNHLFRLFRLPGIIFLSEIPNPTPARTTYTGLRDGSAL